MPANRSWQRGTSRPDDPSPQSKVFDMRRSLAVAQHKAAPLTQFKAINEAAGIFESVVSVFGNVDAVGDRVLPGAFKASLDRWEASAAPIPCIWSHQWDNPDAHVGYVLAAEERPEGLWVRAQLDVDKPFARQVYDLLKARRVKEMSFAYDVVDSRQADDGANELTVLELIEVGPTLKGVNPETQLLTVKAPAEHTITTTADTTMAVNPTLTTNGTTFAWPAKAGARHSAADLARLQNLHDLAVELGAACAEPEASDPDDTDDAKRAATPEDPSGGKGQEPPVRSPLVVLAELELFEAQLR
jgi:HK97 family phage prohead protease